MTSDSTVVRCEGDVEERRFERTRVRGGDGSRGRRFEGARVRARGAKVRGCERCDGPGRGSGSQGQGAGGHGKVTPIRGTSTTETRSRVWFSPMASLGRNELCHCGSGRKFKKCHALRTEEQRTARVLMVVVGGMVAAGLLAGVLQYRGSSGTSSGVRVYSAEHGHYHDANGREIP